jgi:hypothetical protein
MSGASEKYGGLVPAEATQIPIFPYKALSRKFATVSARSQIGDRSYAVLFFDRAIGGR